MSNNVKLQANFKLADGTLINVYGDNAFEFETNLKALTDLAGAIRMTGSALGNFTTATAQDLIASQLGGVVIENSFVPPTAPPAQLAEGHCKHGKLVWRESKPGADKAWKGWFCPSPKGTPDQCAPKFVR